MITFPRLQFGHSYESVLVISKLGCVLVHGYKLIKITKHSTNMAVLLYQLSVQLKV